ncbi:hypothetical protein [Streptomyces cylindrosporus]|uniref:Uncharacterized protein n=1 Tax=Streptomyces cylindrosporus TaxID=2927583 RepID=A0ABS9Y1E4_9ACTN|nr:hypothetical protein [Streptomyces cylindrosporus]MCI3271038.1 hypothetical protein [Streptomyces cylindrosporus]
MARKMSKAPTHAWRTVLVTKSAASGEEKTEYLGPYWRRSDATGRLTTLRYSYSRPWSTWQLVNGWIEAAPLGEWIPAP